MTRIDPFTGNTGLVPSEYIKVVSVEELYSLGYNLEEDEYEESILDAEDIKGAQRFMPELLGTGEEVDKTDSEFANENIQDTVNEEGTEENIIQKIENIAL